MWQWAPRHISMDIRNALPLSVVVSSRTISRQREGEHVNREKSRTPAKAAGLDIGRLGCERPGKLTGDRDLEAEGKISKAKGAAHNAAGDVKDAARDAADALKK